jgi:hypothetical protein
MTTSDATVQVNFRLTRAERDQFSAACERAGLTKSEVLQRLATAFTASAELRNTYHLDGTLCPLSQFFRELADTMRNRQL